MSFFVFKRWLSFDVFSSGDWWYYYAESMKDLLFPSVWNGSLKLGVIDLTLWRYLFFNIPFGLFGLTGYGQEVAEKITIFWPTLLIGNISVFFLIRSITKSSTSGFIGSIIYNYSSYYLGTTHILLYTASVWSVSALLFYIKAIENRRNYSCLAAISLSIACSYDLRIGYIAFFIIFIFLASLVILKKISIRMLAINLKILILFLLLNLYWILPLFFSNSFINNSILNRSIFGSSFLNIKYSLTTYYPFWTGEMTIPFKTQPIPTYYWILPATAFYGLYLNRKSTIYIFFGLLAILGILLSKQTDAPFIHLYEKLFTSLPGFNAFREATKFFHIIILSYSVLIASVTTYTNSKKKDRRFWVAHHILALFCAIVVLYTAYPIITGKIGSMYIPRKISNDDLIFRKYINRQNEYSRLLFLPVRSRYSPSTLRHPSLNDIDVNIFENSHNNPSNLASLMSIRHIVVPILDSNNDNDFFKDYGKRDKYLSSLNQTHWLKKIDIGTKELVVYENEKYRPHIYVTNEKESVYREILYKKIAYEFINPTEYSIFLSSVKTPFYINFSDEYHPDWKLRVGKFNWYNVFREKSYFIPDKYHLTNDAKLNSFFIDPNIICKSYNCKKNTDGTYDIAVSLYLRSQSYMYLGLIISGATFTFSIAYMTYYVILEVFKRK